MDHAERSVRCAIQIDQFAQAFRAEQAKEGIRFGVTRIGVHTGEAAVGNYGSLSRKEYGAIGDAVNIAARLEGLNKFLGTRLCVSEMTAEQCSGIAFRPLGEAKLKGKSVSITVFEPLETAQLEPEFIRAYNTAYRAMMAHDPAALNLFERLERDYPADGPVSRHLERLRLGERGALITMIDK